MRAFPRLLASVKATKFLEPYAPTGLTGLFTHPAPRSALLYLYHSTLDKLQAFPESSAYRQSAEAVTRQRLNMVEQIKPAGYDAWLERSRKEIEENTKLYEESSGDSEDGQAGSLAVRRGGNVFVAVETDHRDPHTLEWDGEPDLGPALEGTRTEEEKEADQSRVAAFKAGPKPRQQRFDWEPEPQLDADQIAELENQIGAGLIEEVIQVAEGELKLVDVMAKSKVWEQLDENPPEGQWAYFGRGTHTGTT